MNVTNLKSTNGNRVPNQFDITHDNHNYFQSYNSIIVHINYNTAPRTIELDSKYWNYSRTTSKYRNIFLGETTKETEAKIKNGEYKLVDLNK